PTTSSELSEDPPANLGLRPEDLLESPGLANKNPDYGPLVKVYFLVYCLTSAVQKSWVERNSFKPKDRDGLGPEVAILDQTPLSCQRAYVQFETYGECPAVFIALNETKEELEQAQDFAPSTGSELNEDPSAYRGLRPEDLLESPGLTNKYPADGPLVKNHFLVYCLTRDVKQNWVRRNQFKYENAYQVDNAILKQTLNLPLPCRLTYVEYDNRYGQCLALFIASNETKQELERACNFALIKKVVDILQTNEPPVWMIPVRI
ncbi:hypothetical protein H0H92_007829, partial [Tricholoma furcatifolium]